MNRSGAVGRVGVEGTGSYGAGLTRYLAAEGVVVVEVNRPDRQVVAGTASPTPSTPKPRPVLRSTATPPACPRPVTAHRGVRVLRLARRSAIKARTQAANQIPPSS